MNSKAIDRPLQSAMADGDPWQIFNGAKWICRIPILGESITRILYELVYLRIQLQIIKNDLSLAASQKYSDFRLREISARHNIGKLRRHEKEYDKRFGHYRNVGGDYLLQHWGEESIDYYDDVLVLMTCCESQHVPVVYSGALDDDGFQITTN